MKELNLREVGIFSDISDSTIEKLNKVMKVLDFKKKEMLFFEKDIINKIFIVYDGKVSLFRISQSGQRRVVYLLGAGEVINEVIFDDLPASISCEAFEKSVILYCDKNALTEVMSQDFQLTQNIINSMGRKIRRLYRQMKNTIPIGVDKKIAAKLWKLSKDYGSNCCESYCDKRIESIDCEEWTRLDVKITVTYLADMLGSTRETVSREMKKLQNLNLIKWEDGKKLVVKRNELLKFYRDKN